MQGDRLISYLRSLTAPEAIAVLLDMTDEQITDLTGIGEIMGMAQEARSSAPMVEIPDELWDGLTSTLGMCRDQARDSVRMTLERLTPDECLNTYKQAGGIL